MPDSAMRDLTSELADKRLELIEHQLQRLALNGEEQLRVQLELLDALSQAPRTPSTDAVEEDDPQLAP